MSTLVMFLMVMAVVLGAAILGWLVRAQRLGFTGDSNLERGEGDLRQNGD